MERYYGPEWPAEEKVKRREMTVPEARYIFVRPLNTKKPEDGIDNAGLMDGHDRFVGFVHYRFVVEEDVPVAYVYELQLESCAQGKGLGKFLMQLIELIARKVVVLFFPFFSCSFLI
jgi:N-alpha-acetyltransferase 40